MKTNNSKPFVSNNKSFRVWRGKTMNGDKVLWIDLHGDSYVMAASNVREATKFAKSLRDAADWIDEHKRLAFKTQSRAS